MSFANQYIQKYGDKAIEAYKRSLNHADHTDSPRMQPKHLGNRSKSSRSITNKSKKKQTSSKSMLHPNGKAKGGMGQAFSNIQLNLGVSNPQKKKLIISDINTPKNSTPNKGHLLPKGRPQSKLSGISTNVNVYVQAVNHSKSKESTPGRGLHNSRQHSANKKSQSQCELIKQITQLIQQQQCKRESKGLKIAREKLNLLSKLANSRQKQFQKMQGRFAKLRNIVGKSTHRAVIYQGSNQELQEQNKQMQSQLQKYKQKEKTLLRIVQSLSVPKQGHRWKETSEYQHPPSSQQDQII